MIRILFFDNIYKLKYKIMVTSFQTETILRCRLQCDAIFSRQIWAIAAEVNQSTGSCLSNQSAAL